MLNVSPYLIFNNNCKEAVNYYKTHLGGELFTMTYGEAKQHDACPPGAENLIIHACLKKGNFTLFASDTPQAPAKIGDNAQLYLNCESREEVDRLCKALSSNGSQTTQVSETFWGSYFGMVTDQFGIHWMLGFELPKK